MLEWEGIACVRNNLEIIKRSKVVLAPKLFGLKTYRFPERDHDVAFSKSWASARTCAFAAKSYCLVRHSLALRKYLLMHQLKITPEMHDRERKNG